MPGAPAGEPDHRSPQDADTGPRATGLRALVVDDEAPAREELGWLLRQDTRIGSIRAVDSGADALRALDAGDIDVVFSDISMPGLDGMELARVIARFSVRPQVVFVTAHDQHAVDAFAIDAADYVMKPVRAERLAEAVRRVVAATDPGLAASAGGGSAAGSTGSTTSPAAAARDETIPVELGGVTRFINRSDIRYAQAQGDYARLHTGAGSHLVRIPLSVLEERWAASGFVRIHRSTLVSLPHIREVRMEHGRCSVVLDGVELQVSRRHTRDLRDRLLRTGPRQGQ